MSIERQLRSDERFNAFTFTYNKECRRPWTCFLHYSVGCAVGHGDTKRHAFEEALRQYEYRRETA